MTPTLSMTQIKDSFKWPSRIINFVFFSSLIFFYLISVWMYLSSFSFDASCFYSFAFLIAHFFFNIQLAILFDSFVVYLSFSFLKIRYISCYLQLSLVLHVELNQFRERGELLAAIQVVEISSILLHVPYSFCVLSGSKVDAYIVTALVKQIIWVFFWLTQ